MADIPKYLGQLNCKSVSISTGNTSRTGASGAMTALVSAGANGTIVKRLKAVAVNNTTLGALRFFKTGDGTHLVHEIPVSAVDVTAVDGSAPWSADEVDVDIPLLQGESLYVATHKGEAFHVSAWGQDY